jgi:anti-sigma regulatory factor (Ser/Thr protein kinase)
MYCLTVQLVEELQGIVPDHGRIKAIVSNLRGATLPGIVEYGCLRWANKDHIPPLPSAIADSSLGLAMQEVRSELGLRSSGPPKSPMRRLDEQPVEFHVVESEEDLEQDEMSLFLLRFERSAKGAGFSAQAAARLHAALHAMTENAVIHANAPIGALIGYRVIDGTAQFCVGDVGVGVLASLRTCPDYASLALHNEALKMALRDGTSRFGRGHGGFGFRQVFKALAEQWGHLRFRSGEGCVTMDGTGLDYDTGVESYPPPMPGFQVSVCCRASENAPTDPIV